MVVKELKESCTALLIGGILLLFLWGVMMTSAPPTPEESENIEDVRVSGMPQLLIQESGSLGGLNNLIFNQEEERYVPVKDHLISYVLYGSGIRARRSDAVGGTLAIPSALAPIGEHVFAMIPSYHTLLKLDRDLSVRTQENFGPFTYAGSFTRFMRAHNNHLFFFYDDPNEGTILFAYDRDLNRVGSLSIPLHPSGGYAYNLNQFLIVENTLYVIAGADAFPAVRCASEARMSEEELEFEIVSGCSNAHTIVFGAIDIHDPKHMRIEMFKQVTDESIPESFMARIDSKRKQTLMVEIGSSGESIFTLRSPESMTKLLSKESRNVRILALTQENPFYALVEKQGGVFLLPISLEGETLTFGEMLNLNLSTRDILGTPLMKRFSSMLFIVLQDQLRVAQVVDTPELVLTQNLSNLSGEPSYVSDFFFWD